MNIKNSYFLFTFFALVTLAAVFSSGCGSNTGTNRSNSAANRGANSSADLQKYQSAPPGASPMHYKGGMNAPVVIEEFADFQCPTCALLHPTVQQIHAAYGDRVKIIFRNFPLQMHPKAYDASVAAEAAGLQGKFWEMQNLLFNNQQSWGTASDHRKVFEDYAQRIGLDLEKFRNDMAGMAAKSRVDADMQRARALAVNATPSFFLNGRQLDYTETEFSRFRQAIDAELQKVQSGSGNNNAASTGANK
jgi:protein-disulfide isomerase